MTIRHFDYIDALRGYAILGVIAVHSVQQAPAFVTNPLRLWLDRGDRGVQLFFVASAITLMFSWHGRSDGALNFYARRFFRIAPMFYLAVLFFVALDGTAPRYFAPRGLAVWQILSTILFVNGWHPKSLTSTVPGSWSIAVEMTFYLALPIIAAKVTNLRTAIALTLGALLFAPVGRHFVEQFWSARLPASEHYLVEYFGFFWFFSQLPVFAVAIATFFAIQRYKIGKTTANRCLAARSWQPSASPSSPTAATSSMPCSFAPSRSASPTAPAPA